MTVDLLEVCEGFDSKGHVVEADMFLVVRRGCWTGCFGEEEPVGGSDCVEEDVVVLEGGFAEEGAVEGFGSGDVADAEDEVVDGECWEHGLSLPRGV